MSADAPAEILVELDHRRRVYLTKVGHRAHTRYLVRTEPDGTMIFTPAEVVAAHVLRLMGNPGILADARDARLHPERLVQRDLRSGPDPEVDWETRPPDGDRPLGREGGPLARGGK
jgi:hypothetical protein